MSRAKVIIRLLCVRIDELVDVYVLVDGEGTQMKRTSKCVMAVFAIATVAALALGLCGCGGGNNNSSSQQKTPPDLTGTWKQANGSETSYQMATISDGTIEIYWISNGGDTKSLYWSGTYVAPTEATDNYSWDSVNDHSKTGSALLASNDDSKTITYDGKQLSYSASAMGSTTTVKLEKQ